MILCALPMVVCAGACTSTDTAPAATQAAASQPANNSADSPADKADEPAKTNTEDEPFANTLKWQTASEIDNFGFDVYRSLSEDGPFERINSDVIEGAGTIDEPQRYQYSDQAIEENTTYFYYVESIDYSGGRENFTPIIKAGPKSKSKTSAEAEPKTE